MKTKVEICEGAPEFFVVGPVYFTVLANGVYMASVDFSHRLYLGAHGEDEKGHNFYFSYEDNIGYAVVLTFVPEVNDEKNLIAFVDNDKSEFYFFFFTRAAFENHMNNMSVIGRGVVKVREDYF